MLRTNGTASPSREAQTDETERSIAFPGWGKGDRLRWMRSLRKDIVSMSKVAQIIVLFYEKQINIKLHSSQTSFDDLIRLLIDIP